MFLKNKKFIALIMPLMLQAILNSYFSRTITKFKALNNIQKFGILGITLNTPFIIYNYIQWKNFEKKLYYTTIKLNIELYNLEIKNKTEEIEKNIELKELITKNNNKLDVLIKDLNQKIITKQDFILNKYNKAPINLEKYSEDSKQIDILSQQIEKLRKEHKNNVASFNNLEKSINNLIKDIKSHEINIINLNTKIKNFVN
jgi:hypothetical protein